MTLIAFVYPKLQTTKTWLDKCKKKTSFKASFDKEYGKGAQALLKGASEHPFHIHWSLAKKLTWKKSFLLTCKILGCLLTHWLPMTSILFLIEKI